MLAVELLLFIVFALLVVIELTWKKSWGTKQLPGPFKWPIVGNVKILRELSEKLGGQHKAMLELSKQYDSPVIEIKIGRSNMIFVSGKECINKVLNSEEYDGRPWNFFISLRNMGLKKGITMNDGPNWLEIRNWFVKNLKSVGFARREMTELIKEELSQIIEDLKDGGVKQMKPIIFPAIINVLWTFIAGKKFNKEKINYFIDLLDKRARAFDMTGGLLSSYPWLRHLAPNYSGYNILVTLNGEFKKLLTDEIEEHKKNHVVGSEKDLIDIFLNEMYAGKGPQGGFDDDQLLIVLVDVLLAGLNITSLTLELLFLNILINQESQKLLHEEIDRTIGVDKLPDFSDKSKMAYTEAVILESQRLVPVVPIIGPRRVLSDTKLYDYHIPKESYILINLYSVNVDPNLYPDPYSFKPERFLKDGTRIRDDNLIIFGKGRRQCPGVGLAKTALFILFTGVMQHYELLPVPGQKPPSLNIKCGLTLASKPYDVLIKSRVASNTRKKSKTECCVDLNT